MRVPMFAILTMAITAAAGDRAGVARQVPKEAAKPAEMDRAAAAVTRAKQLKTKVTGTFKDARIGEILKEFAAQVEMETDEPVMWVYGAGFPHDQKVTYACDKRELDAVLDQLLTKAGGGLGYVVVSKDGDKYDGWVRLTRTGERGTGESAKAAPSADTETTAAERLVLAKKLLAAGKPTSAKPLLEIITKKYASTKAAAEAKELLEKLDE